MSGATAEEKARLLRILENHSQSFLSSFASSANGSKRKNERPGSSNYKKPRISQSSEDEKKEDWHGISRDTAFDSSFESEEEDEVSGETDFEHTDEETFVQNPESNVVVFSEPGPKKGFQGDRVSKAEMKAFMSSKISKLNSNSGGVAPTSKTAIEEEDRTNAQNDALLHKLVYTKLLSGSLSTELKLTPAQRRKALAGRVLELAGEVKLGKGEKVVRETEKNKASKRVREGISQKQKERGMKELEQAKNLGNYHPTLKKLFEASGSSSTRKREKGMKMGVGKFSNGALKLSREDLKSIRVPQSEMSSSKGRKDRGKFQKNQ
ncbi:hypothetical protein CPB84DRAFT_13033 [Gymnopilus junonius]|uniref:Uncharacterized protein n=1 Tax=Gymnopilus junonius TaxID=109634 RepID=A0A9P5P1Q4_GYMJU|nr:hypothetical protein CPB84DRAFT_13033 [Gymnopilus junonius]